MKEMASVEEYSEEQLELINDMNKFIQSSDGRLPLMKEFRLCNGLRSVNYHKKQFKTRKMGSLFKKMGIELSNDNKVKYTSFEGLSKDDLIDILINYNENIGFPVQREFVSKNQLPSYGVYDIKFGSFRNALIIAGIDIPEDRKKYFDRDPLSDDEMLKLLSHHVEEQLRDSGDLLDCKAIDSIRGIPSVGTYLERFESLSNMYSLIGYDYDDFHNQQDKNAMKMDLVELSQSLKRTPSSRDIDKMSKMGLMKSAKSYTYHFGSINDAQVACGLLPTIIGRRKSKNEMLNDLWLIYERTGRLPAHRDIQGSKEFASVTKYASEFGSFSNAIERAGFKNISNSRVVTSPGGVMCMSSYEYDFCSMLEKYNISFKKDEYYKQYIRRLDKNYQFDFTILFGDNTYFVEIFGMYNLESYRKIADKKKALCLHNSIKLISLYPDDIKYADVDELYDLLMQEIDKRKCELNDETNRSKYAKKEGS